MLRLITLILVIRVVVPLLKLYGEKWIERHFKSKKKR